MLKSQTIRLVDVAVIGPAMVWAAVDLRQTRPWLANLLAFFGVTTIGYNAYNYYRYQQLQAGRAARNWPTLPSPQQPPPGAWV